MMLTNHNLLKLIYVLYQVLIFFHDLIKCFLISFMQYHRIILKQNHTICFEINVSGKNEEEKYARDETEGVINNET